MHFFWKKMVLVIILEYLSQYMQFFVKLCTENSFFKAITLMHYSLVGSVRNMN